MGCSIAELDTRQGVLVIGSNLRMEVPIVAHRVRKAARKGASVAFLNPAVYEYYFKPAAYVTAAPDAFVANLAAVLAAAAERRRRDGAGAPRARRRRRAASTEAHRAAAQALARKPALVLLGHIAQRHPQYRGDPRARSGACSRHGRGARLLERRRQRRRAPRSRAPRRIAAPGGTRRRTRRLRRAARCSRRRATPTCCSASSRRRIWREGARALPALRGAAVVAFTSFVSDELLDVADVLLPIGTFAETAGTFVNAEGRWQSFDAAADLDGDARPGWRVLRVLGNELELPNCEYRTPSDVVGRARARARRTRRAGAGRNALQGLRSRSSGRAAAGGRRRRSTCRSTPSMRSCGVPSRCKRPCSAGRGRA